MADIPASNSKAKVTPANNTELQDHKGVVVLDAGDISIIVNQGDSATGAMTVPAGYYIPFKVYSIESTATTSAQIFLLL